MYIQDLFNPNQTKKLKGNKLVDNSKNLNSVFVEECDNAVFVCIV